MIPVHSVDPDATTGTCLKDMLAGEPCVVHQHASAEEFLAAYHPDRAAALVLDLTLPGMSGIDLLSHLEHRTMRLPALVLTAHPDVDNAVISIQRGAIGVLKKPPDPGRLRDHCRTMIDAAEEMAAARREVWEFQRLVCTLTEREAGVFELLGKGLSTKQVARSLAISIRTAHIHRSNVMRKLGAGTAAEVAMLAARFHERNGLRVPSCRPGSSFDLRGVVGTAVAARRKS